jgi:hypothetical protein
MDLNGTWRFKLDPKNTGLKETYHDPAYNIEGQWPEITAPGDWEHQGVHDLNPGIKETNPFPGVNDQLQDCPYNGWAWYRKTLQVPQEWAGYDLELFVGRVDDYDWTYFNGKEIGHTAYDTNPKDFWQAERKYRIPKEAVKFGGINVIAIRVFDCRDKGGIMGDVELRCPGLRQAFENRPADAAKVKPAVAWSSPLSIATILTAGQDPLKLWGWNERGIRGPQAIVLPLKDGVKLKALAKTGVAYDPKAEGELAENWALLWPDEGSADKPVLAVFLDRPRQIAATVGPEKGTSRIEIAYGKEAARIVLARPFRDPMKFGDRVPADVVELCRFWGKALLAYPVAFTEVNEQRADDPWSLDVTDVYTYRFLKDAWGTEPLKVAPLPPFAIYAAEKKFSGVALPESAKDLGYNMGKFGRLKGAAGADRISYRVPLDRIPAFGGTTSFAFSPIDIGPGNALEVKAVSLFGGNGWRPQTVKPPCPELQHCLKAGQELGVNVLHNSSSDYAGGNDKVPGLYERLAEAYKDLANMYSRLTAR